MELKQFVAQALTDILEGVGQAQESVSCGTVVPKTSSAFKAVEMGITNVQPVDFEVAVSVNEAKGSNAKLNVVAAFVGGGVAAHSGEVSSHAAKLSFRIPVRFPQEDVPET